MQADQVITGDCRLVLPRLVAAGVRVQTCITSPPYYGLRDYGLPGQIRCRDGGIFQPVNRGITGNTHD